MFLFVYLFKLCFCWAFPFTNKGFQLSDVLLLYSDPLLLHLEHKPIHKVSLPHMPCTTLLTMATLPLEIFLLLLPCHPWCLQDPRHTRGRLQDRRHTWGSLQDPRYTRGNHKEDVHLYCYLEASRALLTASPTFPQSCAIFPWLSYVRMLWDCYSS